MISKSKMISIAKKRVQELGYWDPHRCIITIDDDNRKWLDYWEWLCKNHPECRQVLVSLNGRDYQSIYSCPRGICLDGDMFVFVDKNTGEVIDSWPLRAEG